MPRERLSLPTSGISVSGLANGTYYLTENIARKFSYVLPS